MRGNEGEAWKEGEQIRVHVVREPLLGDQDTGGSALTEMYVIGTTDSTEISPNIRPHLPAFLSSSPSLHLSLTPTSQLSGS